MRRLITAATLTAVLLAPAPVLAGPDEFPLYLIAAIFTYSVNADGAPPFRQTHLYQAEFSPEACAAQLARVRQAPRSFVKALNGDVPTWTSVTVLAGWRCVQLEVVD